MNAGLALVLCLAAPGLPVTVEGEPALRRFIAARLLANGHEVADGEGEAAVRVRVTPAEDGAVLVSVDDRRGPIVERLVENEDEGERRLAAWLVVRGALERVDVVEVAAPPAAAPEAAPVVHVDTAAPARREERLSLGAVLEAAPDVALSPGTFLPVGAHVGGRYRVLAGVSVAADAGYVAALSGDTVLHGLPMRIGAEISRPLDDAQGPLLAGGARVAATPTWAAAGQKGGAGVGAALGVYGRLLAPLGGALWGVVEAGVETRVLRQAVLADTGVREEALFAAPLAAGLEVRW